ncbi:MAG TPA: hypothetical protein PLJ27_00350 [Polyangiaceae bacterium]|nr:hypothetical protein [Polyangiaceae bacterium]
MKTPLIKGVAAYPYLRAQVQFIMPAPRTARDDSCQDLASQKPAGEKNKYCREDASGKG